MKPARLAPPSLALLGSLSIAFIVGCGSSTGRFDVGDDADVELVDTPDADGDLVRDTTGIDTAAADAGLDVDTQSDPDADMDADGGSTDAGGDGEGTDSDTDAIGPDAPDVGPACGDGSDLALQPGVTWDGFELGCLGQRVALRATAQTVGVAILDGTRGGFDRDSAAFAPATGDSAVWATREGRPVACLAEGVFTVDTDACTLRLDGPGGALWSLDLAELEVDSVAGTGPDEGNAVRLLSWITRQPADGVVVGCGEHTGPLDRRGTRTVHWNTDAYSATYGGWAPDADPLYASIPFCTTVWPNTALGVVVDAPERTRFDLAATRSGEHRFSSHGVPTIWLLPAREPDGVMAAYHDLVGAPAVQPRWAFGLHQSRWGYNSADDVLAVADGFDARGLPLDVLWLDIQHMDGFRTFTFDPTRFGDPAGLMRALRARGLRTVAIADPGIKVDPGWNVYDSGLASDVFIRNLDGTVFVGSVWAGPSSFPDFSLTSARAWWAGEIAGLVARGVDGIWLDVNEPTTFPEGGAGLSVPNSALARGWPGHTMASLHNLYGQLEAEATVAGLRAASPGARPLVVSRAGYLGIHRSAGLWTGDVPSTWWGLEQTLPMLANLSVSGVPFVGSDVGGYSGGATPELFARWFEVGVLSPFFRAHVTNGVAGQEPWMFGQEVLDISRIWLRERYALIPYFEALALQAHRSGAPVLRPMAWEFTEDPTLVTVESQIMVGPWLLAAPVLNEGATERVVRLPAGRWVSLQSGATAVGPAEVTTNVTLAAMPLWLPQGALLPRVGPADRVDDLDYSTLAVDVVGGPVATTITVPVGADGTQQADGPELDITQQPAVDGTRVVATLRGRAGTQSLGVRLRQFDRPVVRVVVDGRVLTEGTEWTRDPNAALAEVDVQADADGVTVEFVEGDPEPVPATIRVHVTVRVPLGTPTTTNIHIAGTFNGWEHAPMEWSADRTTATTEIEVPRDRWYEYKFTRGSWETVEKWPGCVESTNRYAYGGIAADRADEVWLWRDLCEF